MLDRYEPLIIVKPVSSLSALASILSTTENELINIAGNVALHHKPGKAFPKKNSNEIRRTHDAKPKLKCIHEHIKNRLLKQVIYPSYMMGGIADFVLPRNCYEHAGIHLNKKVLISEDIANFFPSTTSEVIKTIWQRCFNFTPVVAEMLTALTTYNGELPQGWKASGYLANLVFWDVEPKLVKELNDMGFSYSRFMDDITISSKQHITAAQKKAVISKIYGMLFSKGFKPRRDKHQVLTGSKKMSVTGLGVNTNKLTLTREERAQIRAVVFQLESRPKSDKNTKEYAKLWKSASGRVGRYKKLHKKKGADLYSRLQAIKPPKHLLR